MFLFQEPLYFKDMLKYAQMKYIQICFKNHPGLGSVGTVEMEADWLRVVSCQSQGMWGSLCSSLYGSTHLAFALKPSWSLG